MNRTIRKSHDRLNARLAELDTEDAAGADEQATVVLDQQAVGRLARMDLMQRQQMAKETQRRRNLERARIAAALKRIEDGEYGWCADCGEEIGEKRLAIDPTAGLCVACAH